MVNSQSECVMRLLKKKNLSFYRFFDDREHKYFILPSCSVYLQWRSYISIEHQKSTEEKNKLMESIHFSFCEGYFISLLVWYDLRHFILLQFERVSLHEIFINQLISFFFLHSFITIEINDCCCSYKSKCN